MLISAGSPHLIPHPIMTTLDFSIDIETLAATHDAAIINIACVPFSKDGSVDTSDCKELDVYINPMSAICAGLAADQGTCKWWAEKPAELKDAMTTNIATGGMHINCALGELLEYIRNTRRECAADRVRFWSQGKDFDFPILENALLKTGVVMNKFRMPWKYNELRCARDYIFESIEYMHGPGYDPYEILGACAKKDEEEEQMPHMALYDARRTAANVTKTWNLLKTNPT